MTLKSALVPEQSAHVVRVGAEPGDAGLLTLRVVRAQIVRMPQWR